MALYYLRHLRSAAATGRRLSGGGISGISGGASETLALEILEHDRLRVTENPGQGGRLRG